MAYYAMIRHLKPKRVVEVGSGFSTLVASAALAQNGSGEIVCIEPFPRPFLSSVPNVVQVVEKPVQQLDSAFFNELLGDGDILFIDSTHTVKAGSDCLHLYLRVLPALERKVMVHVHDVFLPEAMPQDWALNKHIYWTEQYLLLAYLLDNPRVKVWFGSNYHRLVNQEMLSNMMHGRGQAGGGSFWFQLAPRDRTE
jgi:predicted O-methyltransferase YrrM